jgi:RNA polymerase sigma-32 factor
MTREEEHVCATEYARTKSPALAARLVAANMRLVVKIAYGYRRAQYDLSDLVQEGNLGLVQAVLRYDANRGVRLCSYAAWWIRAYISKYTLDNWRLVKAGTSEAQRKLFFTMRKQQRVLESNGVEADSRHLAAALNVKEKDVILMLERASGTEAPLDGRPGPTGGEARSLAETLGDAPALQPDLQLETADFAWQLQDRLKTFGDTLAGRELAIFRRRLLCAEPETLAELALDFGVSRERTRQLENRLKERLRLDLKRNLGDALEVGPQARYSYTVTSRNTPSNPGFTGVYDDRTGAGRMLELPTAIGA